VGDTITVRSRFHKMVEGFNTEGENVGKFDMSGIKWKPGFTILNIDSSFQFNSMQTQIAVFINSKYPIILKQYSHGGYGITGDFLFKNDSFDLEFKLIPKISGKFFMANYNGISISNPQEFPGMCRRNGWACYWNMNKGKDNNQDLLDNAPDPGNKQYSTGNKAFFWHGNFCFEVVD
jgi:hypothetical protein